ncbi:MAG: helix-turn-helix domain-containing protein [Spirochaetaceae bacterium]|nr:helix-turn-helix domain-containing protein [Spirochaetaceae bacterium]
MLNENAAVEMEKTLSCILDFQEVTNLFRISGRTLYRMMKDGLPCWKDEDGQWNFLREDILSYMDTH